jgi:WD40 repeat protein
MPKQTKYQYDVLISHAEIDQAWAKGYLLNALTLANIDAHSEIIATSGIPRLAEFEWAVQQSQHIVLVVSPAYLANDFNPFIEVLTRHYGAETKTWPVMLITLHSCTIPTSLAPLKKWDVTNSDDWPGIIEQLCMELGYSVPDSEALPPCPYPGMVSFQEETARFFYGRDTEIEHLLQHLHQQHFLLVIGPAGSGKSSLVFAGLIPKLREDPYFPKDFWLARSMRPGSYPAQALGRLLKDTLRDSSSLQSLLENKDPNVLLEMVQTLLTANPPAERLLLVIDQFEELFTQANFEEKAYFIASLQLLHKLGNCALIIILRADFYHDLINANFWSLDANQHIEVLPLRDKALRRAIEQPAKDVGVYLEASLMDHLLTDASGELERLPLLQETMVLLWRGMQRHLLTLRAYEDLSREGRSGLAMAIAIKANTTLANLPPHQRAIAYRIFLRLIQFGEGHPDTRRQQPMSALRSVSKDPIPFNYVLVHLAHHGLLTMNEENNVDDPLVEITHEALITRWPRLQEWVTIRREAEQVRRRLEARTLEWLQLGRNNTNLLDKVEMLRAERWLATQGSADLGYDPLVQDFIQTSQAAIKAAEQEEQHARERELAQIQAWANEQEDRIEGYIRTFLRARYLIIILVGMLLLTAGIAGYELIQQRKVQTEVEQIKTELVKAEKAKSEIERLRLISLAQALATQTLYQQNQRLLGERDALLARQAYFFNQRNQGPLTYQFTNALRAALNTLYLSHILKGHEDVVHSVAFSPDGKKLISGSFDATVRVWNLEKPEEAQIILRGHERGVYSMVLSPDGTKLVFGDSHATLWLWDLEKLEDAPRTFKGLDGIIHSISFSPDGKMVASGGEDKVVRLWNLDRPGEPPIEFKGHEGIVYSVSFSPDGKRLASGSEDKTVRLWNLEKPKETPLILNGHEGVVYSTAFSPDGSRLISGGSDATLRLWILEKPEEAPTILKEHEGAVRFVTFSPDGKTVVSGSDDRTLRLWDLEKPEKAFKVLEGHEGPVVSVKFNQDGKKLASGSGDKTIRLWDLEKPGDAYAVFKGHEGWISSITFSSDGKRLASGGEDTTLRLWNLEKPDEAPTIFRGHKSTIWSVSFSPDRKKLASGGDDSVVWLWDLERPEEIPIMLYGHEGPVWSVSFSPDGKKLASGGNDMTVRLWDLEKLGEAPKILKGHKDLVRVVAFSPDGKKLASGSVDKTIWLWDLEKPERTPGIFKGHEEPVWSVLFSPDGKKLASGSVDKTIRLWNLENPKEPPIILKGHKNVVRSVSFSPNGKQLVSGSEDSTALLWDLEKPEEAPRVFKGHEGWISSVLFSPDGKTLASGGDDRTILIWFTQAEDLANWVCEKVQRNLTADEWKQLIGADIPYERTCPDLR